MSSWNSVDPSLRRVIRVTADEIIRAATRPTPNSPRNTLAWATVEAITLGVPATLTVKVGGSSTEVSGVKFLASYFPRVGDYVACIHYGHDLVVLGPLSNGTAGSFVVPMSYAVQGALATGELPIFYVPVPVGQVVLLESVRAKIASGTSCAVSVQRNGSGVTGLTGITVTDTSTTTSLGTPLAMSNNDEIGLDVTTVTGTPTNLSLTYYFAIAG